MEADGDLMGERQIDRKVDGWHGCLRVVERRDGLWQSSLFQFFFFFLHLICCSLQIFYRSGAKF
jgi:hypothetical protein